MPDKLAGVLNDVAKLLEDAAAATREFAERTYSISGILDDAASKVAELVVLGEVAEALDGVTDAAGELTLRCSQAASWIKSVAQRLEKMGVDG